MFGAFALDVSNFQAGSFGTPAFFLGRQPASFSDDTERRPENPHDNKDTGFQDARIEAERDASR
jgi:hypothetical protein